MSTELQGAINFLVKNIEKKSQDLAENKRTVNSLCREAGLEPMYADSEFAGTGFSGLPSIRSSQFYGKTPTVAAREYLDLRGESVPLDEILEALQRGGFDFESQNWNETMRLKNLGISMGKNSSIFHRLPNDTWGLIKWYPNVKPKKVIAKENGKAEPTDQTAEPTALPLEETEVTEESKTKTANAD